MARGLIFNFHGNASAKLILSSVSRTKLKFINTPFCASSGQRIYQTTAALNCTRDDPVDTSRYKQVFSKRMAMAGLNPHHPIAIGVSGGPDSMALCVLAAEWKRDGLQSATKNSSKFIDGMLAIIVDHGLRAESKSEAELVQRRVLNMDVKLPVLIGQMESPNRATCKKQLAQSDDQAELFILRLSRYSGVLGLAGMAFTSQMFDTYTNSKVRASTSILLVRPLLEFTKDDMYKICIEGNQEWVEDPTNQSQVYVRNRIRRSLKNISSSLFQREIETVLAACGRTRMYVDQFCHSLIKKAVTITTQGYAVVDLEIFNSMEISNLCLSKFVTLVLQFISQRHRPIRGSALKQVMDYVRTYPCKTSFTAAGCYLCPAPGSKGTRILVCCLFNSSLPLEIQLLHRHSCEGQRCYTFSDVEQVVAEEKSYSGKIVLNASDVHFLDVTSSTTLLTKSKRLGMLSESTYKTIISLQNDEIETFLSKTKVPELELETEAVYSVSTSMGNSLHANQMCYYMNRFLLEWKLINKIPTNAYSVEMVGQGQGLGEEVLQQHNCKCGLVNSDMALKVRHMIEADWLYLAELLNCRDLKDFLKKKLLDMGTSIDTRCSGTCSELVRLSAERALLLLKSIPVAARRSLPVLVHPQGLLLSIPSIEFKHCPCLEVSATWKPKIPLGGSQCSYL